MPSYLNGSNGWRRPKKPWRYPGVPIPERLKHKYTNLDGSKIQ